MQVNSTDLLTQLIQDSPLQEVRGARRHVRAGARRAGPRADARVAAGQVVQDFSASQSNARVSELASKNRALSAEVAALRTKNEDISSRFDQMHGELNRAHDQIQRFQASSTHPNAKQSIR